MTTAEERRTYHRLEVNLLFTCQPLTAGAEPPRPLQPLADSPFRSWFNELRPALPQPSGEPQEDLGFHRQMLQYIEVLERKIALLEAMITDPRCRAFFQQPPRPVVLSAAGISFPAAEPLEPDTICALTFFLPHVALLVNTRIRIMRAAGGRRPTGVKDRCYAGSFLALPPDVEDEIARFIILTERQQLRSQRLADGQQKEKP